VDKREIRREANFRAGLILDSIIAAGWSMDESVVRKYGQATADAISEEIEDIARMLRNRGGRE
jgi:hypothetical protein